MAEGLSKEEVKCCSRYGICVKIIVVILLCSLGLSFMMMLDSPGSLQHRIMIEFNVTAYQFSLLYSMSSWPNAFCWFAGFLIDRYLGVRLGSIIFLSISCFGNILYVLGVHLKIFWLMVLARLFFGFGGEATSLACNAYILLWFPNKGTNMVFGLAKSVPWLGSLLIFQISNRLYEYLRDNKLHDTFDAFAETVAITMSIIFICLGCAIILALISRPLIKQENKITEDMLHIKMADIFKFPAQFWILMITSGVVMNSCFNFILMAQNFFYEKYSLDINSTDNIISFFGITSCLAGPVLGFIVDQSGRNLTFITLSILGALTAHLLYLLTSVPPALPIILLAFSLSLMISSSMSAYTFLVKSHEINTAYGVVQTVTSGLYASGILIVGDVITKYKYQGVELFYCICLGGCLIACSILWVMDYRLGGILNSSQKRREYNTRDQQSLINKISRESKSRTNYGGTFDMVMRNEVTPERGKSIFTISGN